MEMGLQGKVVVITGATANIGLSTALAFASEGARVVVSGRDAVQGEKVVAEALARGAEDAIWVAADLLDPSAVLDLADTVLSRWGSIEVLVNNAGGSATIQQFAESREEDWEYDIAINLVSTLRVTRAFLPHMIARRSGRIINIGSTAGTIGDPYLASYSAAKAGVHGFTRVLACEVGTYGITVNAIAPYATRPDRAEDVMSSGSRSNPSQGLFCSLDAEQQELIGTIYRSGVLPRLNAKAIEVAAAAVYLAGEHAGYITGEILYLDGGISLAWSHPDVLATRGNLKR